MEAEVRTRHPQSVDDGIDHLTREEGIALLDRQARAWLGVSGEEFVRTYRAGEVEDACDSDVIALSMLMRVSEEA